MATRLKLLTGKAWPTLRLAAEKFLQIDGEQRAAAFAFSAFFAMFPLILLIVTIVSTFFKRKEAAAIVIGCVEKYVPLSGPMQSYVFDSVSDIISARGEAGLLAFAMLVWAAAQFFTTITEASNKAWGMKGHNWWRSPLKDLGLLTVMLAAALIGITVPLAGKMVRGFLEHVYFFPWAYSLWIIFVPWIVLFLSVSIFYMLAPRRRTVFSEVWFSALCATMLLYASQNLFMFYLKNSTTLNAVYGAFGAIIALMLWIYLSGVIFIFCACLCAAQAAASAPAAPANSHDSACL